MFPLKQITFRSSQIVEVSWEMQVQILADATTKQGQSVLQGKEIQSSDSTCISPGHSHKTERKAVRAISWTGFGLVPAPMRVWDAWQTRPFQQSSSLLRPSCQTIGWRSKIDTEVNGMSQILLERLQCITCMKEYENKSLEELHWEDYRSGRKGCAGKSLGISYEKSKFVVKGGSLIDERQENEAFERVPTSPGDDACIMFQPVTSFA